MCWLHVMFQESSFLPLAIKDVNNESICHLIDLIKAGLTIVFKVSCYVYKIHLLHISRTRQLF